MPSLLVTSLLWAFSFGLIKHHLQGLDPSFVAFSRLGLAFLVFSPWLRLGATRPRTIVELGVLGAVQFGLMYLFYLWAFPSLAAHQVALLTIVTPIWVCLADALWRRRFSWRPLLAACVAIVGTAVALGGGSLGGGSLGGAPWRGILLVQVSNLCFAVGQVWYRRTRQGHPALDETSAMGWAYLGAVVITLPFAAVRVSDAAAAMTWHEASVLLYLGVLASGLGFFLWNHGATQVPAGVLAVLNNAKTPLGLLVSLFVFGETISPVRLLLGGTLVILATVYAQRTTEA